MKLRLSLGRCLALGVLGVSVNVSALTSDNLLVNAGFATDLSGWTYTPLLTEWSNKDVNGDASSGSAAIAETDDVGDSEVVSQCVVLPGTGPFDVGAFFLLPSGQGQLAGGASYAIWYSSSDCSGTPLRTDEFDTPNPPPTDSWTAVFGDGLIPPEGSVSAFVSVGNFKNDIANGLNVVGYVDAAAFGPTQLGSARSGCCASPISPAPLAIVFGRSGGPPTVDVTGAWNGLYTESTSSSGPPTQHTIPMSLTQTNADVTGTFSVSASNGVSSGTVSGNVSGSMFIFTLTISSGCATVIDGITSVTDEGNQISGRMAKHSCGGGHDDGTFVATRAQ